MSERHEIVSALPRPGRGVKALLAVVAALALVGAVVVNWAPGGPRGVELFRWLAFDPGAIFERPWTLVTSGLLTEPTGIGHALWSLVGLYFLTPELEARWGVKRLFRFLALSVVLGNLAVFAGTFAPFGKAVFHPSLVFGPMAAITAVVVAWAKENAHRQIRFMFVLPMTGRALFWVTLGFAALSLVFLQGSAEGALAPLGGVCAGLALGGSPSPVRALWLRLRLRMLRRGGARLTVDDLLGDEPGGRARSATKRSGKAPPLRVLPGGLDDLSSRKPPKDKRYLN